VGGEGESDQSSSSDGGSDEGEVEGLRWMSLGICPVGGEVRGRGEGRTLLYARGCGERERIQDSQPRRNHIVPICSLLAPFCCRILDLGLFGFLPQLDLFSATCFFPLPGYRVRGGEGREGGGGGGGKIINSAITNKKSSLATFNSDAPLVALTSLGILRLLASALEFA